ncbi:hypothetical protein ACKFKG_23835 [Phormidesmis sp. 146-35]
MSFEKLLGDLCKAVSEIRDPCQASNATRYRLSDVMLGAFSVFLMQCESFLVTLLRESDGKVLYSNAFVTNHDLTAETVPQVVSVGRSRWKTENENHPVLKAKGDHLEHTPLLSLQTKQNYSKTM